MRLRAALQGNIPFFVRASSKIQAIESLPERSRMGQSPLPLFCDGARFQTERVQPNESGSVALVVRRCVAFHRGDLGIVKTLRAFAAGNDDVAFVKL
jgi:hypothetical protein